MKTKFGLLFAFCLLMIAFFGVEPAKPVDQTGSNQVALKSCSIDLDCKTEQAPYCNITYSLQGNYGACEAVKEKAPQQVIEGEDCPTGTIRQLIYPNEGSEAVCLKK